MFSIDIVQVLIYFSHFSSCTKCHTEGFMMTAVWTHLRVFLHSKLFISFVFKCWILLKPVLLGGVDRNLHFPVPSMNRVNQTELATFSIMSCWAFFRDSVLLYFLHPQYHWRSTSVKSPRSNSLLAKTFWKSISNCANWIRFLSIFAQVHPKLCSDHILT
jgi:hypothetical protein